MKGVVGGSCGEDWELREGMAMEGSGEFKVKVRAKERRLEKRMGFGLGCFGICCSLEDIVAEVAVCLEEEGSGGRS